MCCCKIRLSNKRKKELLKEYTKRMNSWEAERLAMKTDILISTVMNSVEQFKRNIKVISEATEYSRCDHHKHMMDLSREVAEMNSLANKITQEQRDVCRKFIADVNGRRINKGDFITVVKWISHKDNSYVGDIMEVIGGDKDILLVDIKSGYSKGPKTLSLLKVEVRLINREFAKLVQEYEC